MILLLTMRGKAKVIVFLIVLSGLPGLFIYEAIDYNIRKHQVWEASKRAVIEKYHLPKNAVFSDLNDMPDLFIHHTYDDNHWYVWSTVEYKSTEDGRKYTIGYKMEVNKSYDDKWEVYFY